jgi:hypothetical protein
MTTLEARVAALENDVIVVCAALQQIAVTQTLFSSVVTKHLQEMLAQVKRIIDDRDDGSDWWVA